MTNKESPLARTNLGVVGPTEMPGRSDMPTALVTQANEPRIAGLPIEGSGLGATFDWRGINEACIFREIENPGGDKYESWAAKTGREFGFKGTLSPIGVLDVSDGKGSTQRIEVLARVTLPDDKIEAMLCRSGAGNEAVLFKRDAGGLRFIGARMLTEGYKEHTAGVRYSDNKDPDSSDAVSVSFRLSDNSNDNYGLRISVVDWRDKRHRGKQAIVQFPPNLQRVSDPRTEMEINTRDQDRRKKREKLLKFVVALSVLYPNGLADRALDPFSDATTVVQGVADQFKLPESFHAYSPDDLIDGIPFKNYPPEAQRHLSRPNHYENAELDARAREIGQIFQDLDDHNYDAIRKRSQKYVESDPGSIMSTDTVNKMLSDMSRAGNIEELVKATQSFTDFSGKKIQAVTNEKYDFNKIKDASMKYLASLARYPKQIYDLSNASTITIMDPGSPTESVLPLGGYYDGKNIVLRPELVDQNHTTQ